MTHGEDSFPSDDRNAALRIHLNGRLVPRAEALVSVFDSGFVLGDGVWEGIRVYSRRPAFVDAHLDRLFEGARAIAMDLPGAGLDRAELRRRIDETIDANGLVTGAHLRLMVTRGERSVPFQDPSLCISGPTVVIVPQYMVASDDVQTRGLRLGTVPVRRGAPDVQDPKLNSHSKLNCVLACVAAKQQGADEGLMLDPHGFVATCNSTHFFIVRRGELWTSSGRYCLGGITRANVLKLAARIGVPAFERDFSLTDCYGADEAFCTGTLIGLMPVRSIDGRDLSGELPGPVTRRLQEAYRELVIEDCGGF